MLRKCQQLMKTFPGAARSSSHSENRLMPLLVSRWINPSLSWNYTCISSCLRQPVVSREGCSGRSCQHKSKQPPTELNSVKVSQTERWKQNMNPPFISLSQPDLLISSAVSPLVGSYCSLKTTTANFAQITPQWRPEISAGRRTDRVLKLSCHVNLCIFFVVRLHLYWIIHG